MNMDHDHGGNPYHLNDRVKHEKEVREEATLNHIYSVLDEILIELKAIHKRFDSISKDSE